MNAKLNPNEVINDLFAYEGLKIIQDPSRFNFSLDATLLAQFATLQKKDGRMLDLCAGNAPIPLMLSKRTKSEIVGVEIQAISADMGKRSVALNGLNNQISILEGDLKDEAFMASLGKFDVVTCNPPYFKVDPNSNLNENVALTIARHEVACTLADVVKCATNVLKLKGRFAMVHRPDRLIEILNTMTAHDIEPKRLRFVHPRLTKEANTILIEGIKGAAPGGLRLLPPLIIYKGETNEYNDEVREMFDYGKRND